MYSLLDSIVENQSSGARIVSENHDAGSINWVAGLSDPGEMIGCGMYQQLRRENGETDEAYAPRLRLLMASLPTFIRDKIEKSMKEAAQRRAGLDTTNGKVRMMSAGKLPWHGLGVQVDKACSSAEAIRFAGLDWTVDKIRPSYTHNGKVMQSSGFDVVRMDTGDSLGTVGNRYTPIQNSQGFEFLDGVLQSFGAKYETAGSLYGGAKVWILAHLPGQDFVVNGGDEQKAYVLFENCHDGSGSGNVFPTSERVVCANTLRMASKDKDKGMSIRHTGSVKDKIKAAQKALGIAVEEFADYKETAEALYRKPLEIKHYAHDVLDAVLDITQAQANMGPDVLAAAIATTQASRELARKSFEQKIERRGEILADILERYESERCGIGSIRGTAWSAFNAVTEHADHAKVGRQSQDPLTRMSRRFESVISGAADEMKQTALQIAMKA